MDILIFLLMLVIVHPVLVMLFDRVVNADHYRKHKESLQEPEQIEPSFTASRDSIEQVIDTPPNNDLAAHRLNDREYVLWSVRKDASNLPLVPEKYRSDKTIVLAAMNSDPALVVLASDSLKENRDFVKECWSRCPSLEVYEILVQELSAVKPPTYRDAVLGSLSSKTKSFLNKHKNILKDNPDLSDDEEIILAALKLNAFDFQYASERLRESKKFVLVALDAMTAQAYFTPSPFDLTRHIPEALKTDEEILRAEKKFVLARIASAGFPLTHYDGDQIEFVPKRLKNDKEVLEAIEENRHVGEIAFY